MSSVLLIVGDGPSRDNLERAAVELRIDGCARFMGWRDNALDFLRLADIFVHPSLQEGLSNSLLEAMALGLPVVATRIGGIPEVVGEEGGLLIPPRDAETLAEAIMILLQDHSRRKDLGRTARARVVQHFTWDVVTANFERMRQELEQVDPEL